MIGIYILQRVQLNEVEAECHRDEARVSSSHSRLRDTLVVCNTQTNKQLSTALSISSDTRFIHYVKSNSRNAFSRLQR